MEVARKDINIPVVSTYRVVKFFLQQPHGCLKLSSGLFCLFSSSCDYYIMSNHRHDFNCNFPIPCLCKAQLHYHAITLKIKYLISLVWGKGEGKKKGWWNPTDKNRNYVELARFARFQEWELLVRLAVRTKESSYGGLGEGESWGVWIILNPMANDKELGKKRKNEKKPVFCVTSFQ